MHGRGECGQDSAGHRRWRCRNAAFFPPVSLAEKAKAAPVGTAFSVKTLSIFRIPSWVSWTANFVGVEGLWNQMGHGSKGLTEGAVGSVQCPNCWPPPF